MSSGLQLRGDLYRYNSRAVSGLEKIVGLLLLRGNLTAFLGVACNPF
jgi:hypothetical protein